MTYKRIWCENVTSELDFKLTENLELLVVLLENNDCALEGIDTNQCYEVFIYSATNNTTYIYKSKTGLVDIFNTIYINHCLSNKENN